MLGHRRRPTGFAAVAIAGALALGAGVALAASERTVTAAQAHAVATAINIRHGDVAGFKSEPNTLTPADKRLNVALDACIGETPGSKALADVSSASFVGPDPADVTVNSETQIFPSASMVAGDLAAVDRPHALTCVRSALLSELSGSVPKGETLTTTVARISRALSGTDGVSAVRFTAVVHEKQKSRTLNIPVYVDSIGFAYGQAEVSFSVTSTLELPSTALELRLGALLVERAKAAIG